jgi:hypothetical protein
MDTAATKEDTTTFNGAKAKFRGMPLNLGKGPMLQFGKREPFHAG